MADSVDSADLYGGRMERADSFVASACPATLSLSKDELADDGFYYKGNLIVACYLCAYSCSWAENMDIESLKLIHQVSGCEHIINQQKQRFLDIRINEDEQQNVEAQQRESTDQLAQVPPEIDKTGVPCTEASGDAEELNHEELEKENFKLREQLYCERCMEKLKEILFRPCNDFLMCSNCYYPTMDKCPTCFAPIDSIVKVMFHKS